MYIWFRKIQVLSFAFFIFSKCTLKDMTNTMEHMNCMLWFILVLYLVQPKIKSRTSNWTNVVTNSILTLLLTIGGKKKLEKNACHIGFSNWDMDYYLFSISVYAYDYFWFGSTDNFNTTLSAESVHIIYWILVRALADTFVQNYDMHRHCIVIILISTG